MLKIGDFSLLSGISIYMLRNYSKIGLLKPAYIDETTGYRFYEEYQLTIANRIQALKKLGLGLENIKKIISQCTSAEDIANHLSILAKQKQENLEQAKLQLLDLKTTIEALRNHSDILRYSIEIKEFPRRIIASTRAFIQAFHHEGKLWQTLIKTVEKQKIAWATPAYKIAIVHDNGEIKGTIDIEIQQSIEQLGIDAENVKFKIVEPILAAVITYEGEYRRIIEIGDLIADWINDNNYVISGPLFNVYHVSPVMQPDSSKMVTEVCLPIAPVYSDIGYGILG